MSLFVRWVAHRVQISLTYHLVLVQDSAPGRGSRGHELLTERPSLDRVIAVARSCSRIGALWRQNSTRHTPVTTAPQSESSELAISLTTTRLNAMICSSLNLDGFFPAFVLSRTRYHTWTCAFVQTLTRVPSPNEMSTTLLRHGHPFHAWLQVLTRGR